MIRRVQGVHRRMEDCRVIGSDAENTVGHNHMKVDMAVEVTAEPMHEGYRTEPRAGRCIRAVLAYGGLHRPEKHPEH
ncbi:MAG: hypothetical protein QNL91_05620 [Candidatus Krumholzibacteria bacterium]|nr:hypothetical protein [Candidatus Krumholzibacteria bacterium]